MKRPAPAATNKQGRRPDPRLSRLYEQDETAWLDEMALLIKQGHYEELDYKHLAEFLQDMARRDRREVLSRLTTLLAHLLKWDYQPRKQSRSWKATITTQRQELEDCFDSQTLKTYAAEVLPKAYAKAVKRAVDETGLKEEKFPATCPYTLDEVLGQPKDKHEGSEA